MSKNIIVIEKLCACCKQVKLTSEFWKRVRAKDGVASSCKDCIRVQNQKSYKNHWHKNRERIDTYHYRYTDGMREKCNEMKHIAGCCLCKESDPVCLDFHHQIKQDKDASISAMINSHKRWADISREIAKCVVVCANCHRKIHAGTVVLPDLKT